MATAAVTAALLHHSVRRRAAPTMAARAIIDLITTDRATAAPTIIAPVTTGLVISVVTIIVRTISRRVRRMPLITPGITTAT